MRAVNLIPVEERGPAPGSGRGGRALVAGLAVLVAVVTAFVLASNTVADREAELARVSAEATAAEQQAAALRPYARFAALKQARVTTVRSLVASRFPWERALRDLSRALPADAWVTAVTGTVAPGIALEGATGESTGLRAQRAVPALEITGCTRGQSRVAHVLRRLRLVRGVDEVTLASSAKSDSAGGGGASADCRQGSRRLPQFNLVLFFDAPAAPAAVPAAAAATGGAR